MPDRDEMIQEILDFVERHAESTASLSVMRRILGEERNNRQNMSVHELERRIRRIDDEELAACYEIVR